LVISYAAIEIRYLNPRKEDGAVFPAAECALLWQLTGFSMSRIKDAHAEVVSYFVDESALEPDESDDGL